MSATLMEIRVASIAAWNEMIRTESRYEGLNTMMGPHARGCIESLKAGSTRAKKEEVRVSGTTAV